MISDKDFDGAFLQMMITHHRDGIEMSNAALKNAQHGELKVFAEKTVTDQGKEIERMAEFLKKTAPNTDMNMASDGEAKEMQTEMAVLSKASGDQFDKMFLTTMAKHHASAVAMSQLAIEKSGKSEVVSLAREIVKKQGREIEQLETWKKEWYPNK